MKLCLSQMKLSKATVFLSLDATNVFFPQISLHPDSCRLTTFIRTFYRFKFKRLNFRIFPKYSKGRLWRLCRGLRSLRSSCIFLCMATLWNNMTAERKSCSMLKKPEGCSTAINAPSDKVSNASTDTSSTNPGSGLIQKKSTLSSIFPTSKCRS